MVTRDWLYVTRPALPGYQGRIYEIVKKAGKNGIHSERLFGLLYGHDPGGGPDFKSMAVIICHLNKKLRGEKVYAGRNKRFYRLVKI